MACEATWGESDGFMLSPNQCFLMSYRIHMCLGVMVQMWLRDYLRAPSMLDMASTMVLTAEAQGVLLSLVSVILNRVNVA